MKNFLKKHDRIITGVIALIATFYVAYRIITYITSLIK